MECIVSSPCLLNLLFWTLPPFHPVVPKWIRITGEQTNFLLSLRFHQNFLNIGFRVRLLTAKKPSASEMLENTNITAGLSCFLAAQPAQPAQLSSHRLNMTSFIMIFSPNSHYRKTFETIRSSFGYGLDPKTRENHTQNRVQLMNARR